MRLALAALTLAAMLASPAAGESPRIRLIVPARQAVSWKVVDRKAAFTPTQAEIDQADAALPKAFDTLPQFGVEGPRGVRARWPDYDRQYFGVVIDGRRTIFINAFCQSPSANPAKEYVTNDFDGPCSFRAWYDIQGGWVTRMAVSDSYIP